MYFDCSATKTGCPGNLFRKCISFRISSRPIDIRDQQGKLTVLEYISESSARQAHGDALKTAGSLRGDLSLFRTSAVFSVHFSTLFRATSEGVMK